MSKEEFLQELERKLHVLNEQERRDVLEDYAQHIDLKIRSGQAEEEAVHSLGDPGELAAELLDVYHINSEYASDSHAAENAGGGSRDGKDGPARKARRKIRLAGKLREKITASSLEDREQKKAIRMQKKEERKVKTEARIQVRKEKIRKARMRKERKRMDRNQREYRSGGTIVSRALARLGSLIWACILFCWKACLFAAALPVMLLGAFCLFMGGVVLVLLLQGYPLVGVGIGTLGLTISSFGLTALILSWVFTGKKNRPAGAAGNRETAYTAVRETTAEARQAEYFAAGTAVGAAGKTAGEKEQDRAETSVSASQRTEQSALQLDDAQKFAEKTTDEPQN